MQKKMPFETLSRQAFCDIALFSNPFYCNKKGICADIKCINFFSEYKNDDNIS
jgi:hypothetical protein